MFLLFSALFAVWCFHHSTFSAQRYDNFQERQKHTLINLLFWREWNLPLAKFLSVENNKPLKDLRTVWMIGFQEMIYVFMLFFVSTISSVVYLRCRMQIQAKPMDRKRFWSCLLSNGGRNCSKRFTAWPFLIQIRLATFASDKEIDGWCLLYNEAYIHLEREVLMYWKPIFGRKPIPLQKN